MKIKSTKVLIQDKLIPATLDIENGIIKAILPYTCTALDYGTAYIIPGFMDIHMHGGYGYSCMGTADDIDELRRKLTQEGTTSILATTTSLDIKSLKQKMRTLGIYIQSQKQNNGARILGIHQEGPFLNKQYRGSQKEDCLLKTSIPLFQELQICSEHTIKRVTLASEEDNHHSLIKYLKEHDIVASNGHTSANYEEAKQAFEDGVNLVTHFYNGMKPFNHREPGLIGASFLNHHCYCEVIADNIHVHMDAVQLLYENIGSKRMILITDANKAKGLHAGEYDLEGRSIIVDSHGAARIKETGSLAGSTAKLNECVRNVILHTSIPKEEVFQFVSKNPATLLHLDDHLGELKEGFDADITILNEDYQVLDTYVLGQRNTHLNDIELEMIVR